MNEKILKTSAVLALGTLLLVPNNKNVYAASTDTEVNQSVKTKEQKYKEAVEQLNYEIEDSYAYMNSYQYKNADIDNQIAFNNALLGLEEAYKQYKDFTPSADGGYDLHTNTIYRVIKAKNIAKSNLNGREVDKSELFGLINEQSQFQATDAYKNAPKQLRDDYNNALKNSYKVLNEGQQNLTNLENEETVKAIKDAKNAILSNEERTKAINSLKDEIAKVDSIKADKALYTEKSYNSYNNAVILAKSTLENPNSSLDQIKSATDLIKSAKNSLEKKQNSTDKSRQEQIKRLEKAIKENKTTKEAAKLLKKVTPNIASKNMNKLNNLIKKSDDIINKSTKVLNQLKGIRG